jgi:hypothetical protein
MEELDAVFEIGPSLNYRIKALPNSAWWIDLPLRFVYAIDSKHEFIGRVFQPRLSWRKPAKRLGEWKLHFLVGPAFSRRPGLFERRASRVFLLGRRRRGHRQPPGLRRRCRL